MLSHDGFRVHVLGIGVNASLFEARGGHRKKYVWAPQQLPSSISKATLYQCLCTCHSSPFSPS
jgi:hypothetical protein